MNHLFKKILKNKKYAIAVLVSLDGICPEGIKTKIVGNEGIKNNQGDQGNKIAMYQKRYTPMMNLMAVIDDIDDIDDMDEEDD